MKKSIILIAILLIGYISLWAEDRSIHHVFWINTEFPDQTIDNLRKLVGAKNGFIKSMDNHRVNLKIPAKHRALVLIELKRTAFIIDNAKNSTKRTEKLITLKTRLKTKNTLLTELYGIFNSSNINQTIDVEQEVNQIVLDIERLKGQIRFIENSLAFAEITIYINRQGSVRLYPRVHVSHWSWINRLGLKQLLAN